MRFLTIALSLMSAVTIAQPVPDNFSQEKFEKQFRAADKTNSGMLTREQAYAAFPRMPKFFDEIDTNKDNKITIDEVRQAIERRANAALDSVDISKRYSIPANIGNEQAGSKASAESAPQFASKDEAQRYQRNKTYEEIAAGQDRTRTPGDEPTEGSFPNVVKKTF